MLFQEYEPKEIYIGISDRFASVWIQIKGSRQEISFLLHNSHLFSRGALNVHVSSTHIYS